MSRHEIEDGMGFSGLAPTPQERAEDVYRQTRDRIAHVREAQLKKKSEQVALLRAALGEIRTLLMAPGNPLHNIENALVPLDHAVNETTA